MKTTLTVESTKKTLENLKLANQKLESDYPGDTGDFQPVQTLYGGAQLFKFNTTEKIGSLARKSFAQYAPNPETLANALNLPGDQDLWKKVHERVNRKLENCAVEDLELILKMATV